MPEASRLQGEAVENPWVFRFQIAILAGFTLFVSAIVTWIVRLIYISWVWRDVFSASIGIALVAIPVFLFLLLIFNYIFWGILLNGRKEEGNPDGKGRQ